MSLDTQLLVIGGGIHGAAIARAAATAGYAVRVLEQSRLAAGASGHSTRLIHGGLRYLEHGQPGLVRESLRERRQLLADTPELVQLIPMHIPIYRDSHRRSWYVRAGLSGYALLGGLRDETRFRRIGSDRWHDLDGLRRQGLVSVFRYAEAQTDDAALTRTVMQRAVDAGAALHCPAEFVSASIGGHGCDVRWREDGAEVACRAQVLVNATGAWTGATSARITPPPALPAIELVQGSHLLLDTPPRQGGYYLEAPHDRRPVFLLPWRDGALLGTTETPFSGDPQSVTPLAAERDYLLAVLEHYFPDHPAEITGSYAGVRVLPGGTGLAASRSRETRLLVDRPGRPRLLTVLGGKLTTHRATATRALAMLAATLPRRPARG